jgi:hypothetical protein
VDREDPFYEDYTPDYQFSFGAMPDVPNSRANCPGSESNSDNCQNRNSFALRRWLARRHRALYLVCRSAWNRRSTQPRGGVHASFGDIFNYLNIGAMAAVEPRYNRIVMPFDFLWMKLSDQKSLPFDEGATSVKAKMTETLITQKIGYRFVDAKKVKVDALFGFRYWHLQNTFTLQPTQIANGISQSANWVDGLGGGRIELGLTPKLSAMVAGDAGGGSAKLDYQVAGLLGYTLNRRLVILVGYRYLSVDYRPIGNAGFIYDVAMPGVFVGLNIKIK